MDRLLLIDFIQTIHRNKEYEHISDSQSNRIETMARLSEQGHDLFLWCGPGID